MKFFDNNDSNFELGCVFAGGLILTVTVTVAEEAAETGVLEIQQNTKTIPTKRSHTSLINSNYTLVIRIEKFKCFRSTRYINIRAIRIVIM